MKKDFPTETGIFFAKAVSKLPFWLIYTLSSVFFYLNYHIISYRKKIVFKNLHNSFPEKSTSEIREIAKKFYKHFSDLMLETLKMRGMSESEFI